MNKSDQKIDQKNMNLIDDVLNGRRILASLAIFTALGIVGGVAITYYQSSAKASFDGLPTQVVSPEDYSGFKKTLEAPKNDYTNALKIINQGTSIATSPTILTTSQIKDKFILSLSGEYTGKSSQLFSKYIEFSKSSLVISSNLDFQFTGDGFDISKLAINDPNIITSPESLKVVSTGRIILNDDLKTLQLTITKIETEFQINGVAVDQTTKNLILKKLEIIGPSIPQPSKSIPTYVQASLNMSGNSLKIESSQDSNFVFSFSGQKK